MNYTHYQVGDRRVFYREGDSRVILHHPSYRGPQVEDIRNPEQKLIDQRAGEEIEQRLVAAHRKELEAKRQVDQWTELFHTREETLIAPPITFAIDGFLPEAGTTMLGGLSGHGKTLLALSMAKAMLTGSPLFGHFATGKPSRRIVYLVPESGLAPFAARIKLFKLTEFVGTRLFYRTLNSKDSRMDISHPAIMKACEGADVFLDTAVRFMKGDENSASDQRQFADNMFALIGGGARTVTGLHHSPKSFRTANQMTLENVLRGTGDLGAMAAAVWGISLEDTTNTVIKVQNVKARDFEACQPFQITGRPFLSSTGDFAMTAKPGLAVDKKSTEDFGRVTQVWLLRDAGRSMVDIAKQVRKGKEWVSDVLKQPRPVGVESAPEG